MDSWHCSVDQLFGLDTPSWCYAIGLVTVLTPLAWVRDIKRFSFTFLLGNCLLIATITTVIVNGSSALSENGPAPDLVAFNQKNFLSCIGYCIFAFEGIGVVMPVMHACSEPEKFVTLLYAAIGTLTVVFVFFGTFCYLAYGNEI